MREGIHPNYRPSTIRCACGAVIENRSTRGDFQVEICSSCHPFFTGKQKLLDTEGRIEKFRKKWGDKKPAEAPKKAEAKKPAAKA